MQKFVQWLRDKKSNTLRKWRSNQLNRPDDETNGIVKIHSHSTGMLPSTSRRGCEYEHFFDHPPVQHALSVRTNSLTTSSSREAFPVCPPDISPSLTNRSPRPSPRSTPRSVRRENRQIRFQIPEVKIECEDEELPADCRGARRSPLPPPEIEWWTPPSTAPMDASSTTATFVPRSILNVGQYETASCDGDIQSNARRYSAGEKARLNQLAQRRQSNNQLAQAISGRRTSTTLMPLTMAQIHLVRSLWRQIYTTKGPTVIGTSIFHRLCFKWPAVKEQMRRVPLPPKFQNYDSFVKAHSKAIGELIDQVVENLDCLDIMTDELVRIGKVHARLLRGELTGKFWACAVAETIIDCTLEWGDKRCRSETVRKAWALIVAFVIEKIKIGHHEQRKLMLATRQSSPSIEVRPSAGQ